MVISYQIIRQIYGIRSQDSQEYAVMGQDEVYIDGLMGSRIFISGGNGIPVLKGQGRVG